MSTRKKSKSPNKHPGVSISPSPRRSSNASTIWALMHPSYHPSQNPVRAEKLAEEERDLQRRTETNEKESELLKESEYIGFIKTWKNTEGNNKPQNRGSPGTPNRTPKKTLRRSLPIAIDLNKLNELPGGRKRNSTKKKRRNKTKKRAIKNQRK